ncbi:radical SAM family heme chaperone HemW [Bacillus piscicola]|uniref:radical SAM family heme chaperone HemW n=1 Tax=Bacillus piscicola TaxID=1632684 RepID=UPI001F09F2D9|nr:radical SAM family heme chaperone HemW [Bacillus piscicola]
MAAEAIYVHIPFCTHICYYCDFNKVFIKDQPVDDYIEALRREIADAFSNEADPSPIHSVYIGGGTPTALNVEQLERVVSSIKEFAPLDTTKELEFTVEVNPGEADREKFQIMKRAGVNRLSIGVQSFDNELLKKIGRAHSSDEAVQTVELAKSVGFDNISLDLMFGLPGQTLSVWKETIAKALSLHIPHFSAYSLKIEKKTRFYNWYQRGELQPLSEDLEADMYETLDHELTKAGYTAYEISNFARPGYESRHNKTYWKNDEYYGFGAGAHGYINSIRYANVGPVPHYIKAVNEERNPAREKHQVPVTEKMEEEMFMGLRMKAGVDKERFRRKYGRSCFDVFGSVIPELLNSGLLAETEQSIHLTEKGKLLGNEVFAKFLL